MEILMIVDALRQLLSRLESVGIDNDGNQFEFMHRAADFERKNST